MSGFYVLPFQDFVLNIAFLKVLKDEDVLRDGSLANEGNHSHLGLQG